jgi:hypothetical protein
MQRHKNKLHFTISKAITDVMIKKKGRTLPGIEP